MKYNCVNCGAPIDYEVTKCPYCGTYYYNLALRVNIPGGDKVLARAVLKDINVTDEAEQISACNGYGTVAQYLEIVPDNDGTLLTLIKEDK